MNKEQIIVCGASTGKCRVNALMFRYHAIELARLSEPKLPPSKGPQPRKKYDSR